MKNKKGFTLIEVIVVLSIIALVSVSSTIVFTQTTKKMNNNRVNEIIEDIELATDVYFNMYPYLMDQLYDGSTGTTICTRLYNLQNEGLIEKNLRHPSTNEPIIGTLCVYSSVDANNNIVHTFSLE